MHHFNDVIGDVDDCVVDFFAGAGAGAGAVCSVQCAVGSAVPVTGNDLYSFLKA